ncbi:uncharacterized protein LOC116339482 [Contarinia nasturtii]|uniref:uncharacterized protein LOC116339482 n=1 Tax=Contarinia nasturtii TaxID=265458 RepID=UPI0012D45F61|nr:uncharacterized protein LOC116339482 [Contarinia nasturtii]
MKSLCTLFVVLFLTEYSVFQCEAVGEYAEMYRPQLHYSPPKGWLNDPNGLIYENGLFHLFYQCHPNDTNVIREQHWCHAISSDLVHWKTLPTALYPPNKGFAMFSGGAVFDHNNITGLQTNSNTPTLLLMPAAAEWSSREQNIWLAYSNDGPEYATFKYYKNNPIIAGPPNSEIVTAFRDPIFFQHKDYYVAIVASYNRTKFYNSRNLLNWEFVSEFGEFDGSHTGRWECPSLFPFNVTINGKQVEKYVMIITITDYQNPVHQYFIGSYDGKKFTNENSRDTILWLDHGPDSMAGITYNALPDGRRILISWMGRWEFAGNLNFNAWNGQMGIPRELNLIKVGGRIRLTSQPIREMESLRINPVRKQNINITNDYTYKIADAEKKNHLADIEMTLDVKQLKTGDSFDIVFSGKKDQLKISFKGNEFILDRSRAGKIIPNFIDTSLEKGNLDNPNDELSVPKLTFKDLCNAPRLINSSNLKLRIIIDTNAFEMFADDGLTCMNALFYSEYGIASKMTIQVQSPSKKSKIQLKELNVYEMKSIWQKDASSSRTGKKRADPSPKNKGKKSKY